MKLQLSQILAPLVGGLELLHIQRDKRLDADCVENFLQRDIATV
jgi:hypothetical protein